jgi:hypothetical protein
MSGIGNYPMYEEIQNVIASGNTFTFVYKRAPQQDWGEAE